MSATGLIWCSTPRATVGLVVADGRVVDCPPYARRWAMGRDAEAVRAEQEAAGATVKWLPDGERWEVVCATGHRPRDIPAEAHGWVRDKLAAGAGWLRDSHGTRVGISGMALGTDMWWAQAVLDAGLELHAYVPFPQQPDKWPAHAQATWRRLLGQAARVHYTGDHYDVRYLHRRNEQMVDAAAAVIAVYTGKREGGTYACLRYAERRRRPLVWLDPAAVVNRGVVTSVLRQEAALW